MVTLPIIFGTSVLVSLIIYWISGRISPKPTSKIPSKTDSYACGENIPAGELNIDLERFLIYAVYFLIFDVLAFTMATSFFTLGLAPATYSLIVLAAVVVLVLWRRHQ